MTLTTPFGNPISIKISHISCMKYGDWVDGLKTKVLPVIRAYGINQPKTRAGKLKGAIPAKTPRDCLMTLPEILVAI